MERRDALFDLVCDISNLERAWTEVWGGRTVAARQQGGGMDGVTVADWARDWPTRLRRLQRELLRGAYEPSETLWAEIPRREAGRTRRLGIPTVTDRVAQRAVKNVLEPIFEAEFLPCSHGFRPGRSVFTAVSQVLWHEAQGRRWVLDADIEACFDTIPHARLLALIDALGDRRITRLIAQWCEVGTPTPGYGVAQGAVISPLLANIYLHGFDTAMVEAGAALVRYADDFVVMCVDLEEALWALRRAAAALEGLELRLNEEKTVILPFGLDFTFLGAQFAV